MGGELITDNLLGNATWIYGYLVIAAAIAVILVYRHRSSCNLEMFYLAFFLLTGNINGVLTFSIPGIDFFEIQPDRFLFLLLGFLLLRKFIGSGLKFFNNSDIATPWFMVALFLFIIFMTLSLMVHLDRVGVSEALVYLVDALTIVVIIYFLRLMMRDEVYKIISSAIIIGALVSTIISIIQFGIDPLFMRYGDMRPAFGAVIRSNGIFSTEYFNSYFIITALIWVAVTIKSNAKKYLLGGIFVVGIISTFHRMSWIVLLVLLSWYFIKVERVGWDRLVFAALTGAFVVLTVLLFYQQDIMNSSVVKERLSDTVGGRAGYFSMVFDNIYKKPFFGYGGTDNEVYYRSMMQVTGSRDRATGESGDIHNGYLTAMFYFGIPAFICFTVFIILSLLYFGRLVLYHNVFVITFAVTILYTIGNLTNNFSFGKYVAILYAIHLGLGLGARYLPEFFPDINTKLAQP